MTVLAVLLCVCLRTVLLGSALISSRCGGSFCLLRGVEVGLKARDWLEVFLMVSHVFLCKILELCDVMLWEFKYYVLPESYEFFNVFFCVVEFMQ